ncbi:MAG: hypothetical protein KKD53_07205, partial [Proteobacteria bacterium]|nr:hypothetical protein [Pseudomonadota bacterium]
RRCLPPQDTFRLLGRKSLKKIRTGYPRPLYRAATFFLLSLPHINASTLGMICSSVSSFAPHYGTGGQMLFLGGNFSLPVCLI